MPYQRGPRNSSSNPSDTSRDSSRKSSRPRANKPLPPAYDPAHTPPGTVHPPRWERRRETSREAAPDALRETQPPTEMPAAEPRSARWQEEKLAPLPGAVPAAPDETALHWDEAELEALARETLSRRGRKVSSRRARRLAKRAHRRHVAARNLSPEAQAKRARKLAARRRPLWLALRRVACVLAVLAIGEGVLCALTAPQFAVTDVTSDSVTVAPQAAVESAKTKLLGQNFFRAQAAPAVQELAKLPSVQSVSVTREWDWPPRLHVHIQERQPFARVGAGNHWLVVDREGVPFRTATPQDEKLYAVSSKALTPKIGQPLPEQNWAPVVEFAQALADDTQKGHDWALRAIYFDKAGFASLRLGGNPSGNGSRDRMLVHLGIGPWDKKFERARQSLAWLESKGLRAETLNLVSADRPVWTPRREAKSDDDETEQST
jgi:cell division septal protein FtsQ